MESMDWPWRAVSLLAASLALLAWAAQGKEAIVASGQNYLRWDGVLSLETTNLDATVMMYDFIVVAFYSPVSPYCQRIAPEYIKAAAVLSQETPPIILAALDANLIVNHYVNRIHGVRVTEWPTFKIFRNKGLVEFEYDYRDAQDAEMMIKYLRNEADTHRY